MKEYCSISICLASSFFRYLADLNFIKLMCVLNFFLTSPYDKEGVIWVLVINQRQEENTFSPEPLAQEQETWGRSGGS